MLGDAGERGLLAAVLSLLSLLRTVLLPTTAGKCDAGVKP